MAIQATNNKIDQSSNHAILCLRSQAVRHVGLLRSNELDSQRGAPRSEARILLFSTNTSRLRRGIVEQQFVLGYTLTNNGFGSVLRYNDNGLNVGSITQTGLPGESATARNGGSALQPNGVFP